MPEETIPKEETPKPVEEKKEKRWFKPFLFSILGIVLAAGLVFVGIQVGKKQAGPVTQPTPTAVVTPTPTMPTSTPDLTTDWKTYASTKHGFSLKYPDEITLKEESDGSVSLSLWGPTQKADTEFYDGISLRFDSGSLGGKTLKQLVEEKAAQDKEVAEILMAPTTTVINGISGFGYRVRGLGEFTSIYVSGKPGSYIEIINSTNDPTGKGFEETVDLILSTFKFLK